MDLEPMGPELMDLALGQARAEPTGLGFWSQWACGTLVGTTVTRTAFPPVSSR